MSWQAGTSFDANEATTLDQSPPRTSPTAASPGDGEDGSLSGRKRKRSSTGAENGEHEYGSVVGRGSIDEGSPGSANRPRHQPGVKRACNDCRQQKVGSSHQTGWTYGMLTVELHELTGPN